MKYSRDIRYAVSAFTVIFLEAVLGKFIAISGAMPMLTFAYVIVCAIIDDDMFYIVLLSVILGVFSDILYSNGFGIYTVSYSFAAYYTLKYKDKIFYSKWIFLILDALALTALQQFFYMIFHIGDIGADYFLRGFVFKALPTSLYTTVICCVFYCIGGRFFEKRR